MRRLIILTAAPLALAACDTGKTVKAENASIAEVAEAVKGATKFEPGQWENTVTVLSAEAPGLPPQMADMMKKQMATASARTSSSCMTKEMADKPGGEMFAGKDNGQCRYERFEMGGGKIDGVMVCKGAGAQGGEMRMTMAGNFTAATYDMTSDMTMSLAGATGGPAAMKIKTRVAGKRVGECAAVKG